MNYLPLVMALLFLSSGDSFAKASGVKDFQSNILLMRVSEILNGRHEALIKCESLDFSLLSRMNLFKKKSNLSNVKKLSEALSLLKRSENHPHCQDVMNEADIKLRKLQRKKFDFPIKALEATCALNLQCVLKLNKLIMDLDPFCVTQNSENYFGVKDPNPCMAGDYLLGSVLRKPNDPFQERIHDFLSNLQDSIGMAHPGDKIDLWEIYLQNNIDTSEDRKYFLSLLAFFYYTMGTAGGYIDGVSDHYWMSAFKESLSPEEIFTEFYSMKQKIDWFGHLKHKKAKKKKIQFVFKHIDLTDMNRHDYMAMFLSCHFRKYGFFTPKLIPRLLGVAYESLDFMSHIKSDVSFKASAKNFTKDVSRYHNGSALGNGFCAYKF